MIIILRRVNKLLYSLPSSMIFPFSFADLFDLSFHRCSYQCWHFPAQCLAQGSQTRGPHVTHESVLCGQRCFLGIHTSVGKCLEKRYRKLTESKPNEIQCGFRPGRSTTDLIYLSSKFLKNLGRMAKTSSLHMFCRPRENIRPGSSWKALGSVAGVRCWRQPVTGRQVTVYLLRSLCPCRES